MTDLALTVAPKSDQLNADDLIVGPRTIEITKVTADMGSKEQPILIYFKGDNNKPYKPCLSMRRVILYVWGKDGNNYVGRSMTLFREPKVTWGGLEVGGIRIRNMSHIDGNITMALTMSKQSRKPYTVKPLVTAPAVVTAPTIIVPTVYEYDMCGSKNHFDELEKRRADAWATMAKEDKPALKAASDTAAARFATAAT